jgi:hypothetical protein
LLKNIAFVASILSGKNDPRRRREELVEDDPQHLDDVVGRLEGQHHVSFAHLAPTTSRDTAHLRATWDQCFGHDRSLWQIQNGGRERKEPPSICSALKS